MWVCSDCGVIGRAAGDCGSCGKGPLVDAANPTVREYLLDDDVRLRERHRQRLLWLTVIVMVSLYFGGCMMGTVRVAAVLASIQGIIALIATSIGLWFLLQKIFPPKSKFDYLKR
jgi:hypothetical protein